MVTHQETHTNTIYAQTQIQDTYRHKYKIHTDTNTIYIQTIIQDIYTETNARYTQTKIQDTNRHKENINENLVKGKIRAIVTLVKVRRALCRTGSE